MSAQVSAHVTLRLALGTAQFGMNYGVVNRSGRVAPADVGTILAMGARAGVDTLDTAIAYGESECAIGAAGATAWRVITKLPHLPEDVADVEVWVRQQICGSLSRLRIKKLEAVLIHRPADLVGPHAQSYRHALSLLKVRGLAGAVGISIDDPFELEKIWRDWRPDIVQVPCSVFDQRLIRSGWLTRLRDAGIRVHTRSVFLQGLLLTASQTRPQGFTRWNKALDGWLRWCHERETTPIRAAIAFVNALPHVERFVVGVDSVRQFEEVLEAAIDPSPSPHDAFALDDRELLEPVRWASR